MRALNIKNYLLPRPVYYLAVAALANSLGTFLLPFLPLYLKNINVSAEKIGQAVASYGVGCLFACLAGGWISDQSGRKPVIYLNLALSGFFTAGIALVKNFEAILVLIFAIGFCAGMSRPASNALVGDLTSEDRATDAYGLLYWAGNLGFLIASLVGGFIATHSFKALFLIDSATCFIALIILTIGLKDIEDRNDAEKKPEFQSAGVNHIKPLAIIVFITLIAWVIQTQAWAALPLTVSQHGLTAVDWGILSATNGAVVLAFQPLANLLIKRLNLQYSLAWGCILLGAGFLLTPVFSTLLGFLIHTAIWSIGEVLVATTSPALTSMLTSPSNRGKWMGYSSAAFALASIIGPAAGGWAIEISLDAMLWSACGIMGLVSAGLALMVNCDSKLKPEKL